jgi:hypothetical protein
MIALPVHEVRRQEAKRWPENMRINTRYSKEMLEKATPFVLAQWFVSGLALTALGSWCMLTRSLSLPYTGHGLVGLHWFKLRGIAAILAASSMLLLAVVCFLGCWWRTVTRCCGITSARLGVSIEWMSIAAMLGFFAAMYCQFCINGFDM